MDIATNSSFEALLSKNKLSAFVFLFFECLLSENYTSVINAQRKLFTNKSIAFYTVFPGSFYAKDKIAAFLEKYHLKNKVIYDENYFLTEKNRGYWMYNRVKVKYRISFLFVLYSCGEVQNKNEEKSSTQTITFAKDVAPIIHQKCMPCHGAGSVGPFSLIAYHDIRKRAKMIKMVTATRYMSPCLGQ